tara:strand:- start:2040 stop:2372 length:333 start_codon:yes stop_codon:yes gene_type:complete
MLNISIVSLARWTANVDETTVWIDCKKPTLTVKLIFGFLNNSQTKRNRLGINGVHIWDNKCDVHAGRGFLILGRYKPIGSRNDTELKFAIRRATQLNVPVTVVLHFKPKK